MPSFYAQSVGQLFLWWPGSLGIHWLWQPIWLWLQTSAGQRESMFWPEQVKERGSCIQSTAEFCNFKVGKSLEVHYPSILAVPDPLQMIMMYPSTAERGESLVKWAGQNSLIILTIILDCLLQSNCYRLQRSE